MKFFTEKKTFHCKPATDEELWNAVSQASMFGRDLDALKELTTKIPADRLPWSTVHSLCIWGSKDSKLDSVFHTKARNPGIYVNHNGTWLILVSPPESEIQSYIDRCGDRLSALILCYSALSKPDLTHAPKLRKLLFYDNPNIIDIPGLNHLSRLTELSLCGCRSLTQLPSLDHLSQLTKLSLYGCSSLTQLPSLDHLSQLTELSLYSCSSLIQLPSLDHLSQLTELSLYNCSSLTQLPSLENLSQLTNLSLDDCSSLTQLPSLENLSQLTLLRFSGCSNLHELPKEIRSLKQLRLLNLNYMKLRTLPDWLPEIAERFSCEKLFIDSGTHKAVVNLYNTTVEDIPDMSIFEQPYEMVVKWFEDRKTGNTKPLNEIKVVFLGDGEAGKSHTIARLMNDGGDPLDYTDQSTPGIVIKHKQYTGADGRKFQVHYWDFGGQEIMHSMHRIFLTGRTMYVVLINARDDTQSDRAKYWLHNIKSFAPDAPVLLVLNKIDQNKNASVDETDLRSRYPKLTQIVNLSAKNFTKEKFNKDFKDVLLEEIEKTGYLDASWSKSWTQVKEALENMSGSYISGDEYRKICEKCNVSDNQEDLLIWFNDLGVSFCCRDEEEYTLEDYVILKPDWITNALYIILFNQLDGACNGLIPHRSIYRILKNVGTDEAIRCTLPEARYTNGDIQYILGIMRKFNLSFTDGSQNEFIPMLCQQNSMVDIKYYQKDTETLEFNMVFDYLPSNLLHRLMVERSDELQTEHVWRTGAKFCLNELGLSAVVVIDGQTLRFFIQHTNPMHRPNTYLAMLKATVDRIVRKMGLKPPKNHLIFKVYGESAMFSYDRLLKMHQIGYKEEYSDELNRAFLIEDILNQSAPEVLNDEKKLLDAIIRSCRNIQGEPDYQLNGNGHGMEDKRNRRVRDDLYGWGYDIQDQTQRGRSQSGTSVGELDLLLHNDKREFWTAIEALRISNGTKATWNSHLDKLIGNYNFFGARSMYLLTYVDADPATFANIWKGYEKHIPKYNPKPYAYVAGSYDELMVDATNIKAAKCRYSCGGDPVTVYHIFVQIPVKDK